MSKAVLLIPVMGGNPYPTQLSPVLPKFEQEISFVPHFLSAPRHLNLQHLTTWDSTQNVTTELEVIQSRSQGDFWLHLG